MKQTHRDRLAPRHEPYWHTLGDRRALGFRKEGDGHWIARYREPNGPKKHFEPLKAVRACEEAAQFNEAVKAANAWFEKVSAGNTHKVVRGTVSDALAEYVADVRKQGREPAAKEIEARFKLTVGSKPFGRMKLEAVTKTDVKKWREGLEAGREPRSVNRQVRAVVAALNFAVEELEWAGNPAAWALKHLADDGEEESAVFLTAAQRAHLIKHAGDAAALFTGLSHLGCRPKELEAAVVSDFDPIGGTVRLLHRKGKGSAVRVRFTELLNKAGDDLDPAKVEFFKQQCKDKLPGAPLISLEGSKHWTKSRHCRAMQAAIKAANQAAEKPGQRMPDGASAYSFRHSNISEQLQIDKRPALLVAQQTGTSIAMIERTYLKFISSAERKLLDEVRTA